MGGVPLWMLLAGSPHQVHMENDKALLSKMYNKYKKSDRRDAFRSAVDGLFLANTFTVKNPATYMKDMQSIYDTFKQTGSFSSAEPVMKVAFRACNPCSFPCAQPVQLSVRAARAAFRACSFPCVQLSVLAAFRACSFPCVCSLH